MNKALSRLYVIMSLIFILGIVVGFFIIPLLLIKFNAPRRSQQKIEATSFFYNTMHSLFEGTYKPEEESISQAALKKFKEYEFQLGGKCNLFIIDSAPGYYECFAFFPPGDIFNLAIERRDARWVLEGFHHRDWERFWREIQKQYNIKSNTE